MSFWLVCRFVPLLAVFVFAIVVMFPFSSAAGTYGDSAHGNTGYGVLRTLLNGVYIRGNCAHCHEQHTNVADGYLLIADGFDATQTSNPYTQSDNVCFQCHASTASIQSGGITNNNFSATFGGATAETTGILAAFNQATYHNLYDIKRYITGVSGSKTFTNFPAGSNPCSGCHNIHIAKANKRTPGDPAYTALSRPADHNNLWGNDTTPNERMTAYGTAYQPLLYSGSTTLLEPDGTSSVKATQAAKTPDYNTLCVDCHNASNTIFSTNLGRNLRTFDWSLEMHGSGAASNLASKTDMVSPYVDTSLGSYFLSCLDCHEPHGSANAFLIRSSTNGKTVNLPVGSANWDLLCSCCHAAATDLMTFHHQVRSGFVCSDCHVSTDRSAGIQNCTNCHYHGSSGGGYKTF